jgi:hypothetical protein
LTDVSAVRIDSILRRELSRNMRVQHVGCNRSMRSWNEGQSLLGRLGLAWIAFERMAVTGVVDGREAVET